PATSFQLGTGSVPPIGSKLAFFRTAYGFAAVRSRSRKSDTRDASSRCPASLTVFWTFATPTPGVENFTARTSYGASDSFHVCAPGSNPGGTLGSELLASATSDVANVARGTFKSIFVSLCHGHSFATTSNVPSAASY